MLYDFGALIVPSSIRSASGELRSRPRRSSVTGSRPSTHRRSRASSSSSVDDDAGLHGEPSHPGEAASL